MISSRNKTLRSTARRALSPVRRGRRAFILVVVAGLTACASTGEAGLDAAGRDANLITRAEIEATDVATLYEVVQRLRPRWLQVRGARTFESSTGIVVFQGQTFLGDVSALREIDRTGAEALRYLDGARAQATLPGIGNRIVEGAIVIELRAR